MTGGAAAVYVHKKAQTCHARYFHTCMYCLHAGKVRIAASCSELDTQQQLVMFLGLQLTKYGSA